MVACGAQAVWYRRTTSLILHKQIVDTADAPATGTGGAVRPFLTDPLLRSGHSYLSRRIENFLRAMT